MSLYFYFFPPPPPPATCKSLSPYSSLPKASPHLFFPNPNSCSQGSQSYLFSRCKSDQISSLLETLHCFCIAHGVGFRILSGLQAPQVRTPAASYCFFSCTVFPCPTCSPWTPLLSVFALFPPFFYLLIFEIQVSLLQRRLPGLSN